MKPKVLFVCIHNSARSQMAEAFLKKHCGGKFEAHSAGIEPGKLNPIVVEALKETGIDISQNKTKSVQEYLSAGTPFTYVVTVCDETSAERCPVFPGNVTRLHWGFRDPSQFQGTPEEKLAQVRVVRDEIEAKIKNWCVGQCG
jgi:arsenate reductase